MKNRIALPVTSWLLLIFLSSCSSPQSNALVSPYYTVDDYPTVAKYDIHVHVITRDPRFIELSVADGFRLLSVDVDDPEYPSVEEQQAISTRHLTAFPDSFAYAATFKVDTWPADTWEAKTLESLKESFSKGAIAVKVYKNIGMELRDKQGKLVMVDNPRFDPVFDYIRDNQITVIGHLGEPKNCWLPLEQMTVKGDKQYFGQHPQYHMYLHPGYPSYEDQLKARDQVLEKHPDLLFVGAHLGSMEWNVDELAKRLDHYPNLAVDMAARISHLEHQATKDWQKVYDFVLKYQDRLLYGTDLEDSGMQTASQLKKHAHEVRLRDWKFFTSNESLADAQVEGSFRGLHLPREVIDKIYRKNAEKWFPRLLKSKG